MPLSNDEKFVKLSNQMSIAKRNGNKKERGQLVLRAIKKQLDMDLNRKGKARKDLTAAIASAVMPNVANVRSHRYLEILRELLPKTVYSTSALN